jgi:uncharacterized protein YkwD
LFESWRLRRVPSSAVALGHPGNRSEPIISATRHLITLIAFIACGCAAPVLDGGAAAAARSTEEPARLATDRVSSAPVEVRDLVDRINRRRAAIGCGRLVWDARLAAVALRHSKDMYRRGYFSHTNPEGEDPFDRIRRAGLRFRAAAENLAAGQHIGAETFEAWMGSRGHRRNLENRVYTRVGIGLYRDHWTCVLARLEPR